MYKGVALLVSGELPSFIITRKFILLRRIMVHYISYDIYNGRIIIIILIY